MVEESIMKKRLLWETMQFMEEHGKTPDDVMWVGTADGSIVSSWMTFFKMADFLYESDHVGIDPVINPELVVVGRDWWMERGRNEYAEFWEFKRLPVEAAPMDIQKLQLENLTIRED
jgi:hypothetical protein